MQFLVFSMFLAILSDVENASSYQNNTETTAKNWNLTPISKHLGYSSSPSALRCGLSGG